MLLEITTCTTHCHSSEGSESILYNYNLRIISPNHPPKHQIDFLSRNG